MKIIKEEGFIRLIEDDGEYFIYIRKGAKWKHIPFREQTNKGIEGIYNRLLSYGEDQVRGFGTTESHCGYENQIHLGYGRAN
jgi:hypothetical protein